MGPSWYGDPAELDRLAGELRVWAVQVRRHAADHVRRGQSAHWVSAAAQAYRDRIVADRAEADRAADDLERAAGVLHAHAAQIRERLAEIARIERAATAWFEQQATSLLDTAEHVVDSAGQLVKRIAHDAPWTTWPVGPATLPGPGDKRWLEVGDFMRRQGVL